MYNNSITHLSLYRPKGIKEWFFTDNKFGLIDEPLVSGMPEIIDYSIGKKEATNAEILFSSEPLPGTDDELKFLYYEFDGAWYRSKYSELDGWLCSALYFYFPDSAPKKIYTKILSYN